MVEYHHHRKASQQQQQRHDRKRRRRRRPSRKFPIVFFVVVLVIVLGGDDGGETVFVVKAFSSFHYFNCNSNHDNSGRPSPFLFPSLGRNTATAITIAKPTKITTRHQQYTGHRRVTTEVSLKASKLNNLPNQQPDSLSSSKILVKEKATLDGKEETKKNVDNSKQILSQQRALPMATRRTGTPQAASRSIFDVDRNDGQLPPWLQYRFHSSSSTDSTPPITEALIEREVAWLEYTMLEQGFPIQDACEVANQLRSISDGDDRLLVGVVDFLRLVLEQQQHSANIIEGAPTEHDGDVGQQHQQQFVSKNVLVASMLHYADCMMARKEGLHDQIDNFLQQQHRKASDSSLPLLPPVVTPAAATATSSRSPTEMTAPSSFQSLSPPTPLPQTTTTKEEAAVPNTQGPATNAAAVKTSMDENKDASLSSAKTMRVNPSSFTTAADASSLSSASSSRFGRQGDYNEEVNFIRQGAARIKRAEIMTQVVWDEGSTSGAGDTTSSTTITTAATAGPQQQRNQIVMTAKDASRLRGLLLSVTDDWRSLAIRCVACLYRLEGILLQQQSSLINGGGGDGSDINASRKRREVIQAAREGLHVYATLAQRLGMHQLKGQLEDRAFRILYPRQNHAARSLYQLNAENMHGVAKHLQLHVAETLNQDPVLKAELENIEVTSRVKEPFSLWKKLLKKKVKSLSASTKKPKMLPASRGTMNDYTFVNNTSTAATATPLSSSLSTLDSSSSMLSLKEIKDGIGLRVVLRARKGNPDESPQMTTARERFLCYYAQKLLLSKWPDQQGRIKDYIQFPKPNGYQSLHHTSSVSFRGIDIPFEVQVRSEDMHNLSEYGAAAHWDYKLCEDDKHTLKAELRLPVPINDSDEEASEVNAEKTDSLSKISAQASSLVKGSERPVFADSYVGALALARREMLEQQVYVFVLTPSRSSFEPSPPTNDDQRRGHLVSLPAGSRVQDVIELAMQSNSGNYDNDYDVPVAWRNGKTAQPDAIVENGDVLMISL